MTSTHAPLDGPASWRRLVASVVLGTVGGVGMWSVVVVLPTIQAEFGATRAEASMPYMLATIGFAFGSVLMGRLADKFGILVPALIGTVSLTLGYVLAAMSTTLWQFTLAHGLLIGLLGASALFGPLMADVSHWFKRHRGKAVAISASGNYLAGAVWPPIVQWLTGAYGWRTTHLVVAAVCLIVMLPVALLALRRPSPVGAGIGAGGASGAPRTIDLPPNVLMTLICVAGVACCVAMAMPQVHIVAYCGDLGYGVARGAEMLSLMLAFGIVSRVATGFVADKIGGLATLLIGSTLQGFALFLYLLFDGLTSLYVISILFGLFQGGIVPSYAIIVREFFPPGEAGRRVGFAVMATLFGMAFGGWISGVIFDWTGSYRLAFLNGLLWNFLNVAIVVWLITRAGRARGDGMVAQPLR